MAVGLIGWLIVRRSRRVPLLATPGRHDLAFDMARVELDGVSRSVEGTRILDDVSFHVDDGEFVALIGSSGAGKTSVLRAIAGFDPLTAGTLHFDDVDVTTAPTRDRDVGLISQHNTLFPTHRVRANLMFPLRNRAIARAEARKRVEAESRAHNIDHILERWPDSLSGGEQQLTQIARALVRVPQVFLMDEPLAKLDHQIRRRLRQEIVELQRGYGVTTIYASNRPEEIMSMPNRLVALDHGRVLQIGTPVEVQARPQTLALAELTGPIDRLAVTVKTDNEGFWIVGDGIRLRAWAPVLADHVEAMLTLGVRSNHVRLSPAGPITMTVTSATFVESRTAFALRSAAGTLHVHEPGLTPGAQVEATLDRWLLFDATGHLILSFPH